jgi:uncharacterized protein
MTLLDLLLSLGMGIIAMLYTSVGHAGASGYLALMAFASVSPLIMRPTALVLNIIVASFSSLRFYKAGLFNAKLFFPLIIGALPFAFLGGKLYVPPEIYRPLVGIVLILSALRLLFPKSIRASDEVKHPPLLLSLLIGAMIGFIAGLTGTGGGIFLSPLLLFLRWSPANIVSGIAAMFILFTSISGLLGNITQLQSLPPALPLYAISVLIGAFIGTRAGITLPREALLKVLSLVLFIAGLKLVFT